MSNLFDLSGKFAIVTGPQGNLGPIWMETLAEAGCQTLGLGLPEVDITNGCDVRKVADNLEELGKIPDIIVNNAAIDNPPGEGGSFFSSYYKIVEVNLLGAIKVCGFFIPKMIERGSGIIINIGSIQGNAGADWRNYEGEFEKPVGYNVSKAALVQLTRSIAVQYGRNGIRSVCISFAAVDTGKFEEPFATKFKSCLPLGEFVTKDALKTTLLYACCCPQLTGQQIIVDSGYLSW